MWTTDLENRQVAHLVQAMIGAVTPNFRQVTIEFLSGGGIRIHFLLDVDDPVDREEIEDVLSEFDSLQSGRVDLAADIIVDDRPLEAIDLPGRVIYGRKEPPAH